VGGSRAVRARGWLGAATDVQDEEGGDDGSGGGKGVQAEGAGEVGEGDTGKEAEGDDEEGQPAEPRAVTQRR